MALFFYFCALLIRELLEAISEIANIVIAGCNLGLAYYIFVYQRKKDIDSSKEAKTQLEQSIRLGWFRELIIQPRISDIHLFYEKLHEMAPDFRDESKKMNVYTMFKREQSDLRTSFVELIRKIDPDLCDKIMNELDKLIDGIGDVIDDDEIDLDNETNFRSHITSKIIDCHQSLLTLIYRYKAN